MKVVERIVTTAFRCMPSVATRGAVAKPTTPTDAARRTTAPTRLGAGREWARPVIPAMAIASAASATGAARFSGVK
jgi:hypothetical protein